MDDTLRNYIASGWRVDYRERVDSTNVIAEAAGHAGASEGLVVLTEEQTAGRGRLHRQWLAPPGTCLLLSLLFRPAEPFVRQAARITMLCGLSLLETVRALHPSVALKWPNDLIVTEGGAWRKVAGMLSEIGVAEGKPAFLVVGIGLNVNVPPDVLPTLAPHATSLLAETGHSIDRAALLDVFLESVAHHYAQLRAGVDPGPAWREQLAWRGELVDVLTPTESVGGVLEGVADDGALLLRCPDGTLRSFAVGDVSLRR